jgi:TonB family protein
MKRIGLLFAMCVGLAVPALAQPAGIVSVEGQWETTGGKPLYFYNAHRIPGEAIICSITCSEIHRWLPIVIDDGVTLTAPWGRQEVDGKALLTYRRKLLFAQADVAASPGATGGSLWRRAPDVEALEPILADDGSITRKPEIDQNRTTFPDYPPASLRARETGSVALSLCLRPDGRIVWADIKRSSGIQRLDDATLRYAFSGMVLTPAIAGDNAVAVCGVEKLVDWTIADAPPRPSAN